jgi:hypothetical protein
MVFVCLATYCLSVLAIVPEKPNEVLDENNVSNDLDSLLNLQKTKGDEQKCNDRAMWRDKFGDGCDWYSKHGWCSNGKADASKNFSPYAKDSIAATDACCECGARFNDVAGEAGGLKNKGEFCWDDCGRTDVKQDGECPSKFCGNGICCRASTSGGHCDGTHGLRTMRNALSWGLYGQHVCVAKSKKCMELANHHHRDLVKASHLVDAVYVDTLWNETLPGEDLKFVFYMKDGTHDLDFGIADPLPHADAENHPWVVFGGSESTTDWMQNVNALYSSVPYEHNVKQALSPPPIEVHTGFANQLAAGRARVTKFFDACKAAGVKKVFLSGHSLGGAVATLAAAEFASKYPEIQVELITFGAPVVGNYEFGKNINSLLSAHMTRVISSGDPIPCAAKTVGIADNIAGELAWNEGSEQWSSPREDNCNLDTSQASSSITDHLMGDTYKPLVSKKCV